MNTASAGAGFLPLNVIIMEFVRLMDTIGQWPPLVTLEPDMARCISYAAYSPNGVSARLDIETPFESNGLVTGPVPYLVFVVESKYEGARHVSIREHEIDRTLAVGQFSARYLAPAVHAIRSSFLDHAGAPRAGAD